MFERVIEDDLRKANTPEENAAMRKEIYEKFRKEFLEFVDLLKNQGIAQTLYNAATPKETIGIWRKYKSKNQPLLDQIRSWADYRIDYFNTQNIMPFFEADEKLDNILEIGLMIFIVGDEVVLLAEEDITPSFTNELVELLKRSPNELVQAASCHIEKEGFETMTSKSIAKYYKKKWI